MRMYDNGPSPRVIRLNAQINRGSMERDKNIAEQGKKHMKHKPYKCDFGGGKNG